MKIIDIIPHMLSGDELVEAMLKQPTYFEPSSLSKVERLIHTQDLFQVYIPNAMSIEVYNLVYLLLIQGCARKDEGLLFHPSNNDSALVCGVAGCGKSQTIDRINEIMFPTRFVELTDPYIKIIPILVVEVSTVASFKSFLISVLFAIDRTIGTNYGNANNKTNVTTDELLLSVSKAVGLHVVLLVIEEMNFINDGNKAFSFSNQIVALINIVNTSVLFIAVPKALSFFTSTEYLARRALGKVYKELSFDEFEVLAHELFRYNYTLKEPSINSELLRLLYKSTGGSPALLKQVIAEAQVWSINTGYERIDLASIKQAIKNKLVTMEPYLENGLITKHQKHVEEKTILRTILDANDEFIDVFNKASRIAKKDIKNAFNYIKQFVEVEEVIL